MPSPDTITQIITESGSTYHVRHAADDTFWLSGDNRSSATSCPIQGGEWAIKQPVPWPPHQGGPLALVSTLVERPLSTPGRIPGGGKITSPVRSWRHLAPSPDASPQP